MLKKGYNLNIIIFVSKGRGIYVGDLYDHGIGVVHRSTLRTERKRYGSIWRRYSRIGDRLAGKGYYFYGKVSYGYFEDVFGNISESYNDGEYSTMGDLIGAMKMFVGERDLYKERGGVE